MPNMMDYLTWRGDLTLRQASWNLVDSLLMASLSYNPFQDTVSDPQGKTLRECAPLLGLENMTGGQYFQQWRALLFAMAESERFGDMRLHDYVNEVDEERIIQFSALTAEMEDGSTFRFEYVYTYSPGQTGNGSGETGTAAPSPGLFPVRGLTAVFLFITGLYSAVTAAEDSRRGLFTPLPVRLRLSCRFASLAAPVALAALSGLSAVLLSGGPGISSGGAAAILPEAAAMALYALAVSVFSMALGAILKTPEALGAAIPFFIIGSLVFCPVFFDAERLLPGLGQAGRLFLPYYYLRGFFHWP